MTQPAWWRKQHFQRLVWGHLGNGEIPERIHPQLPSYPPNIVFMSADKKQQLHLLDIDRYLTDNRQPSNQVVYKAIECVPILRIHPQKIQYNPLHAT